METNDTYEANVGLAYWYVNKISRQVPAIRSYKDDLEQEALVALWLSSQRVDHGRAPAEIKSYLARSIERRLWSAVRALLPDNWKNFLSLDEPIGEDEDEPRALPVPSTTEQELIAKDLLERVFRRLTSREADVLKLMYSEGLSQSEVAKRLGVSRQAVFCYIKNARRRVAGLFS